MTEPGAKETRAAGHGRIATHQTFLGQFVAQCGCGWLSEPMLNAQWAERDHDIHVGRVTRVRKRRRDDGKA